MDIERVDPVTVPCQECDRELAADSPDLRLELSCDDEPLVYCAESWTREFADGQTSVCESLALERISAETVQAAVLVQAA